MKADIHPNYSQITVTCACGNKFQTGSTLGEDLNVEICSSCHPFYTGKQKVMDTAGRVVRFKERYGRKQANIFCFDEKRRISVFFYARGFVLS